MKTSPLLILGVFFAVLAVIVFSMVIVENPFTFGDFSDNNLVDVNQNVGSEDSGFMWNNTGFALIAQAFVLFAAAAATLCLLKIDEEKS